MAGGDAAGVKWGHLFDYDTCAPFEMEMLEKYHPGLLIPISTPPPTPHEEAGERKDSAPDNPPEGLEPSEES